jgi:hypothetical protein
LEPSAFIRATIWAISLNRFRCRTIASLAGLLTLDFCLSSFTWCIYTFPVAFIVLKQQFPTRPDMDAIPDIIVIFAIFFFPFFLWLLFCSVPRGIPRFSFLAVTPDTIRHLDLALGCLSAGGSLRTSLQTAVG